MKIVICGHLQFIGEMKKIRQQLVENGHSVELPIKVEGTDYERKSAKEGIKNILEHDLIRKHYAKIVASDAILVVNSKRKGIPNYIGGATFLEMGFAYVNNKKIYVLRKIPEHVSYYEEIAAMQPTILCEDLSQIR